MPRYPEILFRDTLTQEIDSFSGLVSAPGPYLEFGEFIYLEASSTDASCTLRISGKFLSTDGKIRAFTEDMTITGTGNQTAVTSRIGPCWLMGFSVRVVAGTITDGEVICSVHIARASASTPVHVMTLASGEVTNTRSLGLGAFTNGYSTPATSYVAASVVTVANPAAGSQWTATVPASTEWEVLAVAARCTLSATVADRYLQLTVTSGGNVLGEILGDGAWVANAIIDFVWTPDAPYVSRLGVNGFINSALFAPRFLPPSTTITSSGFNFQAGDQWSRIVLTVKARSI